LNFCEDQRDRDAHVDYYKEDISNLITLAKMRYFLRDGSNASRHFHDKIRLNAIKFDGEWWAIHKLPKGGFKTKDIKQIESLKIDEHLLQLTQLEYEIFDNEFDQSQGRDKSTLIFNPKKNRLEVESPWDRFNVVCSHKAERKIGLFF
jgi:hypothetical protein